MILLDTHTLLWAFFQMENIPRQTQNLIEETDKAYVSIVSLWEIAIKQSIGKLNLNCSIGDIVHDPFDRLIISQAIVEKLSIVSKDQVFGDYDVKLIWK